MSDPSHLPKDGTPPPVIPSQGQPGSAGKGGAKKAAVGGGVAAVALLLLYLGSLLPGFGFGLGKGPADGEGSGQTQTTDDPNKETEDNPETPEESLALGELQFLTVLIEPDSYLLELPGSSRTKKQSLGELVALAKKVEGDPDSDVRVYIKRTPDSTQSAERKLRDALLKPIDQSGAGLKGSEVMTKDGLFGSRS